MRVTNAMMTNTTLININRNMRHLDKLIQQIESTKKIQVPSDDPIVASRALKFRTSVAETQQFQRNVQNGLAWMNIAEASFANTIENLLVQFRERCVEGATGTEQAQPDKMAIVTELQELIDQIGVEMNQTYAGRYVFSGYRTEQPPVLIEDAAKNYVVTQYFDLKDIEKTKSYQKFLNAPTEQPEVNDINLLKLAYKEVVIDFEMTASDGTAVVLKDSEGNPVEMGVVRPDGTAYSVVTKHSQDTDAYAPPDDGNTIYYIADKGELVMGNQAASVFEDGTSVTYYKDDLRKGELNPLVYFDCVELTGAQRQGTTGTTTTVTMDGQKAFDMDHQEIQYEFATRTYVTVNSLSKDIYTDKMYADLREMCDFALSLSVSDEKVLREHFISKGLDGENLENAVNEQLAAENAKLQAVLHDRFNNMLNIIDRHSEVAMKEQTQMGARGQRLELLRARLEQDEDSYTQLLSDNEDTDMVKALILRSSAEAAYQAALKAGSNIIQLSLANFI